MAKVVNITDKLSFDENPFLEINGKKYEVNANAMTVLEIMGDFANKGEAEAIVSAYERLFSEKDRSELSKLPFKDLVVVVESGMALAQGAEVEGARE